MAEPFAIYKSPNEQDREFRVDPTSKRYRTTNGQTTGPSAYVVQAGQVDVDKPSGPKKDENGDYTYLSKLRMGLTGLQDDINEFLTEQMEKTKNKKYKQDDEIRIKGEIDKLLDGGDDDDDDENE